MWSEVGLKIIKKFQSSPPVTWSEGTTKTKTSRCTQTKMNKPNFGELISSPTAKQLQCALLKHEQAKIRRTHFTPTKKDRVHISNHQTHVRINCIFYFNNKKTLLKLMSSTRPDIRGVWPAPVRSWLFVLLFLWMWTTSVQLGHRGRGDRVRERIPFLKDVIWKRLCERS